MSYNGSGTFSINTAGQPVVTGTTITSTAFNALTADLANGLSTALCKDGQSTPTANIGLGGFKITNLAAGTLSTDAVRLGQFRLAPQLISPSPAQIRLLGLALRLLPHMRQAMRLILLPPVQTLAQSR